MSLLRPPLTLTCAYQPDLMWWLERVRPATPTQTVIQPSGVKGASALDPVLALVPQQPTVECISNEQCALVPQTLKVTPTSPARQVSHQVLICFIFVSVFHI